MIASDTAIELEVMPHPDDRMLYMACWSDGDQLVHQLVPDSGRVVHHLLGMDVVAGASAFDDVAGEGEGSSAESDDREAVGEVLRDQAHSFGDVAEIRGAVGTQARYVFLGAYGLLDDRAFTRREVKG